jgi:uncharacterized protein YidB (DUF937 family)
MQDQRAMLEDELSEMQEKLRNLKAYAAALRQRAGEHGVNEEHYADDLMRAENDAQYYEAEISRLTEALGGRAGGGGLGGGLAHLREAGSVSLVAACVAFAAGVVLGWALLPPRRGQ